MSETLGDCLEFRQQDTLDSRCFTFLPVCNHGLHYELFLNFIHSALPSKEAIVTLHPHDPRSAIGLNSNYWAVPVRTVSTDPFKLVNVMLTKHELLR